MEIAKLSVQPGITIDTTSKLSDIALDTDNSFNVTPGNPIVDDFNPYR